MFLQDWFITFINILMALVCGSGTLLWLFIIISFIFKGTTEEKGKK